MTAVRWPDWIVPNSIEWWLETQSRSGGPSLLGVERIISSPSARWRCTMTFRIWGTQVDPARLLTWRAISGALYGRAGLLNIGPFDRMTPELLAGAPSRSVATTFFDAATFSDGSTFAQAAGIGKISAYAAQGARAITLTYLGLASPQAGQYFGIGGASLYLADTSTLNADGTITLTFSPGLRANVSPGQDLDFERPLATMRLMADDGGRAKIAIGGVADTTLDLVEAF